MVAVDCSEGVHEGSTAVSHDDTPRSASTASCAMECDGGIASPPTSSMKSTPPNASSMAALTSGADWFWCVPTRSLALRSTTPAPARMPSFAKTSPNARATVDLPVPC
jgi:hypothetical protein